MARFDECGNPLLDIFITNGGNSIHKWLDYFEVYHRAFARFRDRPIIFVEIGIQNGGSAAMWRQYFGSQARIIGVDINPACQALASDDLEVWIGDQNDEQFWRRFTAEIPEIDIILDDGGHDMSQQINTFNSLFPKLKDGGVYLCEDTHSSYFEAHQGGLRRQGSFIEFAKGLVDEMHAWYHAPLSEIRESEIANQLLSIAFFDSIVLMEKRNKNPPMALVRGKVSDTEENPTFVSYLDMRRAYGVPDE